MIYKVDIQNGRDSDHHFECPDPILRLCYAFVTHCCCYPDHVIFVDDDFSAAFDTLNHDILLDRLDSLGVSGAVLQWMESYMRGRSQTVVIDGVKSDSQDLQYGNPQGSLLGPILFTIYTMPIGFIAQRYNLEIHIYR